MTGEKIFKELSFVDQKFIEEAAHVENSDNQAHRAYIVHRIPAAVAAVAIILLLVGCAAVHILRLRDMQISVSNGAYGDMSVLLYGGQPGTPEYMALQEWYRFLLSEHSSQSVLDPTEAAVLPEYEAYMINTPEKSEKLEEIANRYNLRLLKKAQRFRSENEIYNVLGIESIFRPGYKGSISPLGSTLYEEGGFHLSVLFPSPVKSARKNSEIPGRYCFSKRGFLNPDTFWMKNGDSWHEWQYTTESGEEVTLGYELPNRDNAVITFAREDAVISVVFFLENSTVFSSSADSAERDLKQALEKIADGIDFQIQPK